MKRFIILMVMMYLFVSGSMAAFPQYINYQGKLTDDNNIPLADGSKNIVFAIYKQVSGGSNIWTETQTVSIESGFFNVLLGSITTLNYDIFTGEARYLGIDVDGDGEMVPRQQLVSVGYAYHAYNAELFDGHSWSEVPAGGNYVLKAGDSMTDTLTVETAGSTSRAVYGYASSGSGTNYGGYFQAAGNTGRGVYATATGSGTAFAVYGYASGSGAITNYGALFQADGDYGYGVKAVGGSGGYGVYAEAGQVGVYGKSTTAAPSGWGVMGENTNTGYGVYGRNSGSGYAGYFSGGSGLYVNQTLEVASISTTSEGASLVINASGIVFKSASSRRYKTDIQDYVFDTDKIMKLRPVKFKMKKGGGESFGLIAEEVYEVFPELVTYNSQGQIEALQYPKLTVILLKGYQEKVLEIEALKNKNEELESRIKAIEAKLNE